MTETRRAAAQEPETPMDVRVRKALGCFVLLGYIAIYTVLAASLGVALLPVLPTWAQLVFYAIAGVIWIFPLKPLFVWINRGQ